VLLQHGSVSTAGGAARANDVQVVGLSDDFWELAPRPIGALRCPGTNEAVINLRLAQQLSLHVGEEFVLRMTTAGTLPRDIAFARETETATALRLRVVAIADAGQFGNFSLIANQVPPCSVFLPRTALSPDRANVLLVAGTQSLAEVTAALRHVWRLEDAQLHLRTLPDASVELVSDRVFLEPSVANVAQACVPDARGVFTYFVNRIASGTNAAPYSFVSGLAMPPGPHALHDDEILINAWLADDLRTTTGAQVTLTYYMLAPLRGLIETTAPFRVRGIIPMERLANDRSLMPAFPGLADVDNCRDWAPGIPIDLAHIRDKDEAYWDRYRGTPKAFVTLATAQRLWTNRYGVLTAVRFNGDRVATNMLADNLRMRLSPSMFGLTLRPVRAQAMRAGDDAVDFGSLFLGLSFFIVLAGLLLTGLLFAFSVEQRRRQIGTLLALGFRRPQARRLLLAEGALLALSGGILGVVCGVLYNQGILFALSTVWRGAVGAVTLYAHITPLSLAAGYVAGVATAVAAMWIVLHMQTQRSVCEQLHGAPDAGMRHSRRIPWVSSLLALLCTAGAAVSVIAAPPTRGTQAAGAFFGAGALLLAAGVLASHAFVTWFARTRRHAATSLHGLGLRTCTRRRGRTLAVIGLLACGIFLVAAVAANRQGATPDPYNKTAGTGGFALYAATTLPLLHDLATRDGQNGVGLSSNDMAGIRVVQLRTYAGDDASCLNLNRAQQPRILGVTPAQLEGRFACATHVPWVDPAHPWQCLDMTTTNGIPAIADQTVIEWGLGKSVGDTLDYVDEHGATFTVVLAAGLENSILQGNVLIAEQEFMRRFPSAGGTQVLLVDAPPTRASDFAHTLQTQLQDLGIEVQSAADRLALFTTVQNTYLAVFLALGGLGVLLGSIGIGVVVMRNALERRGELAALRAIGFSRRRIARLLVEEHALLLALGLACGVIAALVAVLPAIRSPGFAVPYGALLLALAAILANGMIWILAAARTAVRGDLIAALRDE
jgi:ABC-type antimicrobial peptide transport system permease subunit